MTGVFVDRTCDAFQYVLRKPWRLVERRILDRETVEQQISRQQAEAFDHAAVGRDERSAAPGEPARIGDRQAVGLDHECIVFPSAARLAAARAKRVALRRVRERDDAQGFHVLHREDHDARHLHDLQRDHQGGSRHGRVDQTIDATFRGRAAFRVVVFRAIAFQRGLRQRGQGQLAVGGFDEPGRAQGAVHLQQRTGHSVRVVLGVVDLALALLGDQLFDHGGLSVGRDDQAGHAIGSFERREEAGEPVAVQVWAAIGCAGNRSGAFLRQRWSRRQHGESCDE